ncbi:MAG TPA: VOC family protein [Candidatus Acidoferrum sp.]|nr:VOC family protein [Candidatus Acidoferrum sp.]
MKARAKKKTAARRAPAKRAAAKKTVDPIPAGHPTVSPYLIVDDAPRALEFYKKAFSAKELMRHAGPDGRIGHAEIRIGDSIVMLADEHLEINARSPKTIGGTPVSLHVYVKDVDAVARQAAGAGAKTVRPVQTQFYGDRSGTFEDPFGHQWHLSTHVEDVSPAELRRRAAQMGH